MKLRIALFMGVSSFYSYANPYVGLEYSYGIANNDYKANFVLDEVSLYPDVNNGSWSFFAGYRLTDQFAFEFRYSYSELEGDYNKIIGSIYNSGEVYIHEREWNVKIKDNQLYVTPVFFFDLDDNEKLKANIKTGISYTDYRSSSNSCDHYEYILNDNIEYNKNRYLNVQKNHKLGVIMAAGVDYNIYENLWLGFNLRYQVDKFSDTLLSGVSAHYLF